MDFVNLPLLAAAALVFVIVVAGMFSARFGLSFLLMFRSAASWPAKTARAGSCSTTSA